MRSNCIAKFGLTPDSLMDLWIRTLAKHGIDSFWIYDCLYNMDKMERLCRTVADAGCEVVPAIMYGISPVHTDEWFAARVREYVSWGITDAIYFEDAAGILKPERAKTLMPALVEAAGGVPIEMQCHNTVGLAGYNYLIGVESGIRILHTAAGPDGQRSVASLHRADDREPAVGRPHHQRRSRARPTDQRAHAPGRRCKKGIPSACPTSTTSFRTTTSSPAA